MTVLAPAPTSTLSRLESGERRVTIDALERIATALGTTAAAVLADAAREDRLLLPTATVELAGGLTGVVLRGRLRLRVGERQVDMEAGQTAQFATTEPHAFGGIGGTAEILSRFEPGAHRA